MAGEIVRVDTSELAGAIYEIKGRARNMHRIMPVLADALVTAVADVYEAEGPGWAPLSEATMAARRGTSAKILQDTGIMVASTAPATGSDWAEARAGAAYAEFHATGTRHMRKRNPFELGPFEEDFLADAAELLLGDLVQ